MLKIKTLLCLAALACVAAAVTACNTTEGFGKDVEAGGAAIKHSAQDHND